MPTICVIPVFIWSFIHQFHVFLRLNILYSFMEQMFPESLRCADILPSAGDIKTQPDPHSGRHTWSWGKMKAWRTWTGWMLSWRSVTWAERAWGSNLCYQGSPTKAPQGQWHWADREGWAAVHHLKVWNMRWSLRIGAHGVCWETSSGKPVFYSEGTFPLRVAFHCRRSIHLHPTFFINTVLKILIRHEKIHQLDIPWALKL